MASQKDFYVLIIGAGNCGLSIAHGLKKAGVPYTLFERDSPSEFLEKQRDWGMLIHWGREYLLKVLPEHLKPRINEAYCDPSYINYTQHPYMNASTGEILNYVGLPGSNRVSRKKLRRFLTVGENLNIQGNKKLKSVEVNETGVVISFEDGTTATGSALIGADGSHSKVREFLVGKEKAQPEYIGHTMINTIGSGYTAEEAKRLRSKHPLLNLAFHPDGHAALLSPLDASDQDHPENWTFHVYHSWYGPPFPEDLPDQQSRRDFLKERVGKYCEPFKTMVAHVDDMAHIPLDRGSQWAPFPWNNYDGHVTLAGDAAHSMVPHRGQGLNNALQDASDVVDAMVAAFKGEKSLKDSITAYEADLIPRGAKEVHLSREVARSSEKSLNGTEKDLSKMTIFKHGMTKGGNQTESDAPPPAK